MKRTIIAAIALVCCLTLAQSVYAVDEGLEFGVADDLTVLGTGGLSTDDPDVEIKGFTVFGGTRTAYPLNIPLLPGNVWVNGYVQVSSGIYSEGRSTFAAGAYFAESSTFATTVNISADSAFYVGGGIANQVLKKAANGSMVWSDDDTGETALEGTEGYLPFFNAGSINESQVMQNLTANGITLMASSMTIQGTGSDGLGVFGDTKLNGALNVTGAAYLNSVTYLGAAATRSTVTAAGDIYLASGSSITLIGAGAQIVLPNAPVEAYDAANKAYVDSKAALASPWVRDDAINVVKLSTSIDTVGVGIAAPRAKLHVASSAVATDTLFAVSTGTLNDTQDIFAINAGVNGVGEAGLKGSFAIGQTFAAGSAPSNGIAVEGAVGIGTASMNAATPSAKLEVKGVDAAGEYISTFYSGTKLAAWVRQK